jgi:hypothetical protein
MLAKRFEWAMSDTVNNMKTPSPDETTSRIIADFNSELAEVGLYLRQCPKDGLGLFHSVLDNMHGKTSATTWGQPWAGKEVDLAKATTLREEAETWIRNNKNLKKKDATMNSFVGALEALLKRRIIILKESLPLIVNELGLNSRPRPIVIYRYCNDAQTHFYSVRQLEEVRGAPPLARRYPTDVCETNETSTEDEGQSYVRDLDDLLSQQTESQIGEIQEREEGSDNSDEGEVQSQGDDEADENNNDSSSYETGQCGRHCYDVDVDEIEGEESEESDESGDDHEHG